MSLRCGYFQCLKMQKRPEISSVYQKDYLRPFFIWTDLTFDALADMRSIFGNGISQVNQQPLKLLFIRKSSFQSLQNDGIL